MKLYIAEKPSLGRAIAEGLEGRKKKHQGYIETDRGEIVTWCIGHLLEQAEPDAYDPKYKRWSLDHLPIQPQSWIAQPKKQSKSQLAVIRKLCKQATDIVHAGDPDREGQLLVDEVIAHFKLPVSITRSVKRLLISDLNVAAVKKQLKQLRSNSEFKSLSTSALARTRADWLYGMNLSRAYTLKGQQNGFNGVVSIGRVQTPVLGLIVKRDLEIESFESRPFYELHANILLSTDQSKQFGDTLQAKWIPSEACQPYMDDEGRIISKALVEHVERKIRNKNAVLEDKKAKDKKQNATLPLNLSTLQIEASKRYSISAKETLDICQSLYETRKLITYPRSDNRYLPETHFDERFEVLKSVKDNLKQVLNDSSKDRLSKSIFLDGSLISNQRKSKAFDSKKVGAHHAIIPTALSGRNLERLSDKEKKIYKLICCYYLIQFSNPWSYKDISALFIIEGGKFSANQRVTTEMGWKSLMEQILSSRKKISDPSPTCPETHISYEQWNFLTARDSYHCMGGEIKEKETKPPSYYTDGSLLTALTGINRYVKDPALKATLKETDGLGTEATRAGIIELLVKRKFIHRHGKQIKATETGKSLIIGLPDHLALPDRTAVWEQQLNAISREELSYRTFMDSLAFELNSAIATAKQNGIHGLKPLDKSSFKKRKRSYTRKTSARKKVAGSH